MAGINDTLMAAYAEYSAKYDYNNLTRGRWGMARMGFDRAADVAMRMFTPEQIAGKKKALAQNVQLASIDRGGITVTTSRQALPITGTLGDSAPVTIVFNVHEAEFTVVDEEFRGNQISREEYIATKMADAEKLLLNAIDAAAVTAVDAAKAQVTNSNSPFAFTANEFIVPSAAASTKEEERMSDWRVFLDYWDAIVADDGHQNVGENTYMVGSANALAFMNYAAGFGAANAQNKLQSWNGIVPYISTNIAVDPVGPPVERANAYMMLDQSFEIQSWVSGDALEAGRGGANIGGDKILSVMNSAVLGTDIELLRIRDMGDYSARNAKYTRVVGETFVLTTEVAYILPANTDPATYADRHYGVSFQVG